MTIIIKIRIKLFFSDLELLLLLFYYAFGDCFWFGCFSGNFVTYLIFANDIKNNDY